MQALLVLALGYAICRLRTSFPVLTLHTLIGLFRGESVNLDGALSRLPPLRTSHYRFQDPNQLLMRRQPNMLGLGHVQPIP